MITIAETRFDALRARFATALNAQLATQLERPHWDSERIAEHQRSRLRALLMRATEHSPFHAERLRGIAPERFELEQLPQLPVMSKEQMMAGFDELVTDRRITRANVERHLAAYAHEPGLLFGEYVCLVSGGSSGVRGIFVQTLDEFTAFGASVMRRMMARAIAAGGPPPEGMLVGLVAAPAPIHSSGLAGALCTAYPVRIVSAPATLPVPEIVRRLNDTQPPAIIGTPSKLALLATERRGGRLRIAPSAITTVSEVLAAEDRAAIEEAFAVRVVDGFVSTEGLAGGSDPGSAVVNFASDQCIVELVDIDNRPVPEGVESAKVLVTNLHNFTQPLIRYELTDRFVRHPGARDHGHLRATVEGRADEGFRYGSVVVDPLAIATVMVRTREAIEYQVHQTPDGIEVAVVSHGELDHAGLAASLERSLREAGLSEPAVTVREVADIARHPETGKARRYVPLAPAH